MSLFLIVGVNLVDIVSFFGGGDKKKLISVCASRDSQATKRGFGVRTKKSGPFVSFKD